MGAALLRTKAFKETRIKKYFTHLESILSKTDSGFFFAKASYADLALFQVVDGVSLGLLLFLLYNTNSIMLDADKICFPSNDVGSRV